MKKIFTYLKKEFKSHSFDYLLLITAGVFFLISLNIFKGERLIEFIILLIFSAFYIIWGVYHHLIKDALRLKIVVEYILIGFLVLYLVKLLLIP